MKNQSKIYLEKFKNWCDSIKIYNPLEYQDIIEKVFYNNSKEVLWIEFKNPKISISVIQRDCDLTDSFEFYFAESLSSIKMTNCNLIEWKTTCASSSDINRLKFLSKLGMIEFRCCYIISYNSSVVDIKFTLKEWNLENGTI